LKDYFIIIIIILLFNFFYYFIIFIFKILFGGRNWVLIRGIHGRLPPFHYGGHGGSTLWEVEVAKARIIWWDL